MQGHWNPGGVEAIAPPLPGQLREGSGESWPRQSGILTAKPCGFVIHGSHDRPLIPTTPHINDHKVDIEDENYNGEDNQGAQKSGNHDLERFATKSGEEPGEMNKKPLYAGNSAGTRRLDLVQVSLGGPRKTQLVATRTLQTRTLGGKSGKADEKGTHMPLIGRQKIGGSRVGDARAKTDMPKSLNQIAQHHDRLTRQTGPDAGTDARQKWTRRDQVAKTDEKHALTPSNDNINSNDEGNNPRSQQIELGEARKLDWRTEERQRVQKYPWWSGQCIKRWIVVQVKNDPNHTRTIDDYCGQLSYEREGIKRITKSMAGRNLTTNQSHEMRRKVNIMEDELHDMTKSGESERARRQECKSIIRTILSICDDYIPMSGNAVRDIEAQGRIKCKDGRQVPEIELSIFELQTAINDRDCGVHEANGRDEAHVVQRTRN